MQKEVNLALGGGGIRGVAHLGVVQSLFDHNYKITGIAGTSAGGLFGALIAAGYQPKELLPVVDKFFTESGFRPSVWEKSDGLLTNTGIKAALEPYLKDKNIEDLPTPFVASSFSLKLGEEVVISKGDVIQAILSTTALPGVFPSQGDLLLVDGGLADQVPVAPARNLNGSTAVVAVVLHHVPQDFSIDNVQFPVDTGIYEPLIKTVSKTSFGDVMRHLIASIDIVTSQISELIIQLHKPDVVVKPIVGQYGLLQKIDPQILFDEGYRAMEAELETLEKANSLFSSLARIAKYAQPEHHDSSTTPQDSQESQE